MYRHKPMAHSAGIPSQLSACSNSGTKPFLLPLSQVLKWVTSTVTTQHCNGLLQPTHYLHTLLLATNMDTCSAHQC